MEEKSNNKYNAEMTINMYFSSFFLDISVDEFFYPDRQDGKSGSGEVLRRHIMEGGAVRDIHPDIARAGEQVWTVPQGRHEQNIL